jgi:hypothetical protein
MLDNIWITKILISTMPLCITIDLIALVTFTSQNDETFVRLSNFISGDVLMFSYATSRDSFSVYSSCLRNNDGQAFNTANHGRFRGL